MKTKLLALAFGAAVSVGASAAPIALPTGPVFFQFTNLEQADTRVNPLTGAPVNGTGGVAGAEGNWGVAQVSTMRRGSASPSGSGPGTIGNDIDNAGTAPFFVDQLFPVPSGQVTAMFYGIKQTSVTTVGTVISLKSSGGFMDFYWDDPSGAGTIVEIGTLSPGGRTSDSTFTGVTDGVFLGRLAFASGINLTDSSVTVEGTIDTNKVAGSGSADSYANVVDVNGDGVINGADGLWAAQLNSDYFGTIYGTRDVRFSNKIDLNTNWNGADGVLGLTSNDPGRAFVVPEPASLALVGLALVAMGATARRRKTS